LGDLPHPVSNLLGQLLVVFALYHNSRTARTDPWSNGSAKLELAIYYGEPNRISRLKISGGVTLDLGSVSRRPLSNASESHWSGPRAIARGTRASLWPASCKPQASSGKLDSWSRIR